MSGYSFVSIVSIFCYSFLLLTLIPSAKQQKVIRSFVVLMGIMILWTGGSIGMRLLFWPNVNFWHHVSLLGSMLLPFGYYMFLVDFLDERPGATSIVLLVSFMAIFVFNCFTGFFIPLPEVLNTNGQLQFLYHYDWHIYLLVVCICIALLLIVLPIRRHCRGNRLAFQQLLPVVYGILAIFLGNVLIALPIFVGFPIDMLSGAVNALFLFYALYKKKLFRMTILLSKTTYGIIAMTIGIILFSNVAIHIQRYLMREWRMDYTLSMIAVAFFLVITISILYLLINRSFFWLFIRPEQKKRERLTKFSEDITHMLSVTEILQKLSDIVQETFELNRFYVLIRAADGTFRIEHTINPLEEKNFYFRADHPLLTHFKQHNRAVLLQDFSRKTLYRSMWETEKALLHNLRIESFIPLVSDNTLTGILMVSGKPGKPVTSQPALAFMQSAADICASAVSNAYNYERALEESQKDDLTGLLNFKFFFEILEREFEKYKDTALSLCLINIDDFKLYNQLFGANEGDAALRKIAGILSSSIGPNAFAARLSGDEFALILPGYDIYSAKCLAENIADQISTIRTSFERTSFGKLTVSIGICAAPYMASSAKELYRNADTTVYTVKNTGKNAVQMYSADILRRQNSLPQHKSGYKEHASTIYALTAAIDTRDHYTFQHSINVAYYAAELAKAANMPEDLVEMVHEAGLLHDIGKIGIPEIILNKPARLSVDEFESMKGHVESAVSIIRHLPSLEYVIPAVSSHHERYDGNGYPRKLAGDDIPITGRILCIADSFDAITSKRNYKNAIPKDEALKILRAEAGKQFDPNLVMIFVDLVETGKVEIKAVTEAPIDQVPVDVSNAEVPVASVSDPQ